MAQFDDVNASGARLDPATGATLWTQPIDAENFTPGSFDGGRFAAEEGQLVRLIDGAVAVVDGGSGEVTALPEEAVLACARARLADAELPDGTVGDRPLNPEYFACDASGAEVDAPLSEFAVRQVGTPVGDVLVAYVDGQLQASTGQDKSVP